MKIARAGMIGWIRTQSYHDADKTMMMVMNTMVMIVVMMNYIS